MRTTDELIALVNVLEKQVAILKKKQIVWKDANERMPEHNVGVLVFIPGEDNHITAGMWNVSNKWVLLDEYREPSVPVTHWAYLPTAPHL